jgi:hypothetical protein
VFYIAFYLSIETINRPYASLYTAAQGKETNVVCNFENAFLHGISYQLFSLGFGDAMADVLKSLSTGIDESCIELQVHHYINFVLLLLIT